MMVLKNSPPMIDEQRTYVCPLCPLHCDTLCLDPDGSWSAQGCPIVDEFSSLSGRARDRGNWQTWGDDSGRTTRVVTTGVDLTTARRLSQWQSEERIELMIESDPNVQAILDVASRDGTISATLADVATHADQVWLMGRVEEAWPQITKKLRLFPDKDVSQSRSVTRFTQCSASELTEFATRGASLWRDSRYTAVLIGPDAFAAGEEILAATMLNRLVRLHNSQSRCVLVTLDAAATLRSVCLWQSNATPAASQRAPVSSGWDIRLGSPLSRDSLPARIQVGGADWGAKYAKAYRACSIAGLHRASMVVRGDGSVSLPLADPVATHLPSLADVLAQIL